MCYHIKESVFLDIGEQSVGKSKYYRDRKAYWFSISTASKALNGTGSISEAAASKVTEAAYLQNLAAQLLAAKNITVGLLVPSDPEQVQSSTLSLYV